MLWKEFTPFPFAQFCICPTKYLKVCWLTLTYLHNPFRILAATMSVSFLQASLSLGTLSAACREIFKSSKILFYLLFFGWPGNQTKKISKSSTFPIWSMFIVIWSWVVDVIFVLEVLIFIGFFLVEFLSSFDESW